MKIKIDNQTEWSTNDLRAIVHAALKAAGACPTGGTAIGKQWPVHVVVGKTGRQAHKIQTENPAQVLRNRIRGWAHVQRPSNPGRIKLLLPRPDQVPAELRDLFKLNVARVAHHEALHSVGAYHKDMTPEQMWCQQDVPWSASLQLRAKTELRPAKPEVPREERRAADQVERLEHVRAMHKKSLTRVKRAQTFEKKWRRRLKALEKRAT